MDAFADLVEGLGGGGGGGDAKLAALNSGAVSVGFASAAPPEDLARLSAGALKALIASRGGAARLVGVSEKVELVAIARSLPPGGGGGGGDPAADFPTTSSTASAFPVSFGSAFPSSVGGAPGAAPAASAFPASFGAASALERGLGNAFETAGFASVVSAEARTSLDHERQYRASSSASVAVASALAGAGSAGLLAFGSASPPVAAVPVAPAPPARLAPLVRLPACARDPVLREVPLSHLDEAATELVAGVAGPPGPSSTPGPSGVSASQRSRLLPHLGQPALGARRAFELPLRDDASDAAVLLAVAAAGRAAGLDAVVTTQRSALLSW